MVLSKGRDGAHCYLVRRIQMSALDYLVAALDLYLCYEIVLCIRIVLVFIVSICYVKGCVRNIRIKLIFIVRNLNIILF